MHSGAVKCLVGLGLRNKVVPHLIIPYLSILTAPPFPFTNVQEFGEILERTLNLHEIACPFVRSWSEKRASSTSQLKRYPTRGFG